MSETVIVIRSLVPGGAAAADGRLVPGDRLVAVNDTRLDNASLDAAVHALKGAPYGPVRILIARPLHDSHKDSVVDTVGQWSSTSSYLCLVCRNACTVCIITQLAFSTFNSPNLSTDSHRTTD